MLKKSIAVAVLATAAAIAANGYKPTNMSWHYFISDMRAAITTGFWIDYDVKITTRDGITLVGDLYKPNFYKSNSSTTLPVLYIRLPYGKNKYGESRIAARRFVTQGFAVLVQDIRGRHGSDGEFKFFQHAANDGYDTIDWIIKQPWSNGRVGTFGCSALGEIQLITATNPHPALKAMIARGAGGAMGSAAQRYSYFGLFEGGIYNLASGVGWHSAHDSLRGPRTKPLESLPTAHLLGAKAANEYGNYERMITLPLDATDWDSFGFIAQNDQIKVPNLAFNTWYDQTTADTFAIAKLATAPHPIIIGPGNHCAGDFAGEDNRAGDLVIENPRAPQLNFPYWETYAAWFNHYLRDAPAPSLPAFQFFVLQENRWMQSAQWPPAGSQEIIFKLGSTLSANSRSGDGTLTKVIANRVNNATASLTQNRPFDEYSYNPLTPTPTRGGPICCVDDPKIRSGAVDQTEVESRQDVLVFTTEVLREPMRLIGPIQLDLEVSTGAVDTDFIAKVVDVAPDGSTLNIQEGALRLRYREGYQKPVMATPNQRYPIAIEIRPTAYLVKAGHRLRLQITSSNFPRLERNLNTGGINSEQTQAVNAINRIWYGDRTSLKVTQLP